MKCCRLRLLAFATSINVLWLFHGGGLHLGGRGPETTHNVTDGGARDAPQANETASGADPPRGLRPLDPHTVTLSFRRRRSDRMGSRVQLPFAAWLVARHHGWSFCSPPDPAAEALSFPMCASGYESLRMLQGPVFTYYDDNITEPGVYYIEKGSNRNTLWKTLADSERGNNSMFDERGLRDWRRMILSARVRPELDGYLWFRGGSVRIAAHVRRGDILPGIRNDAWIGDDVMIALLEMAKHYVRQKHGPDVDVEVHLFSESYGATNWTRYGALVDEFHLAPERSDDLELNLRDWKHFVRADVLIVGGTFSYLPAIARPGPSSNGLPMTLFWGRGMPSMRGWILWGRYGLPAGERTVVASFPDGTVAATIGASGPAANGRAGKNITDGEAAQSNAAAGVDAGDMAAGLCEECRFAGIPGAFWCMDRIRKYGGQDRGAFVAAQRRVSEKYLQCSACEPSSCRVRVDGRRNPLGIESVIGAQYERSCPLVHPICLEEEYEYL